MNSTLAYPKRRFPTPRFTAESLMVKTGPVTRPDDHDDGDEWLRQRNAEEAAGSALEGDRFDGLG